MGNEISYRNFEKIVKKLDDIGYKGVIFGSWFLPHYIKKEKGVEIDGIGRETDDIDIILNDDSIDTVILKMDDGVKYSQEGVYTETADINGFDPDTQFEMFPRGIWKDISPKNTGKLEEYLLNESNLEKVSNNLKMISPWIWVGIKVDAYLQTGKEKHRHDIAYLKGMVGDKKFNSFLTELEQNGFARLVGSYKEMFGLADSKKQRCLELYA